MPKPKRKLTPAQKAERRRRRREYMMVFMDGKQVRVKRPPTIEGLSVEEFIKRNADPIWLQQNGMWEYMQPEEAPPLPEPECRDSGADTPFSGDDLPY